ncbi:MAG: hypothetical protein FWE35_07180 [Streptosporangiales bacterium]|nr:hypothetical protein [Streptosporangiales bacterium]
MATARGHRPFGVVLALAVLLRIVVMLGYPPAMFFNDSYSYLGDVVTGAPDNVRANGYPFFLRLLEPFHSFTLVTGLQALMGLAMGTLIYAVLRRRGLPAWGGILCSLPVLFDVFQVQIEHTISSDVLFYTLMTIAVILLLWWDRPPWPVVIIVGLMVGYASTVRSVGEPMLILIAVGMIARRMGWKRIVVTVAVGLIPIAAYMTWYHSSTGKYALNESGAFLYSRVQSFAECSRMNPPPNLRVLCDPRPIDKREAPEDYPWEADQPLFKLTHSDNNQMEFTPQRSAMATQFAELAVESQPLSYARVVVRDTLTTFDWNRVNDNNDAGNEMGSGPMFQFEKAEPRALPWFIPPTFPGAIAAKRFGGPDYGLTQVRKPWAMFLWLYQHVFVRGPVLLVIVLIGAAGVILGMRRKAWRDRQWGGTGLLPWMIGASLILLPPMTAAFSYRYELAAVPVLSLAAGLAFAGRGNLITWLKSRKKSETVPIH